MPGMMLALRLKPGRLQRDMPRGSFPSRGRSHPEQWSLLGRGRAGAGRGLAGAGAGAGPHPRGDVVQALQVPAVRPPGSGWPLALGIGAEGPGEAGVFGSRQVGVRRGGGGGRRGCREPWEATVGHVGWSVDPWGHDQGVERSLVEPCVRCHRWDEHLQVLPRLGVVERFQLGLPRRLHVVAFPAVGIDEHPPVRGQVGGEGLGGARCALIAW